MLNCGTCFLSEEFMVYLFVRVAPQALVSSYSARVWGTNASVASLILRAGHKKVRMCAGGAG